MKTKIKQISLITFMFAACFALNLATASSIKAQTKADQKAAKKQAEADRRAAAAKSKADAKIVKETEIARDAVSTNGVGQKAKIELQLRDNTKVQGWVSQLSMDDFVLNDAGGQPRTIAYREVSKAKGKNPAAGKKKKFGVMDALAFIP
ncbi:MAG: hypothetical protein M3033_06535 [Acidobacteriota bacterium]|nr:hypothetical protein [Acidobacteriota bacterium]